MDRLAEEFFRFAASAADIERIGLGEIFTRTGALAENNLRQSHENQACY
jgi:hypothetical protein